MRRDFVGMLAVPDTGNAQLNSFLSALKENIELLCALRGALQNHAVVKGDVETDYPAEVTGVAADDIDALRETLRLLMVDLKE